MNLIFLLQLESSNSIEQIHCLHCSNMKSLSYSPSYSSSSSTTTFDATLCNSKSATAGCLAGILRRILCSGKLPKHPSDHISEAASVVCDEDRELKAKEKIETAATPGIVARMMGLESMPEINWVHKSSDPNSISRSRSMNSENHLAGFDPMQGQHRRVKSTLSFRESPTFLELENENFLILSFENGGGSKEFRSKGRKSELGLGELRQRRAERCKTVENKAGRLQEMKNNNCYEGEQESEKKVLGNLKEREKCSKRIPDKPIAKVGNNGKAKGSTISPSPSKSSNEKAHVAMEAVKTPIPSNQKEVLNRGRPRKKKKKINPCVVQKVESEFSSEDSSPVSVLDSGHFLFDPAFPTSEQDSNLADSKSRRKLSPELENCKQPSPGKDTTLIGDEPRTKKIEGKYQGTKKKADCHSENYEEMWVEILRLTGAELVGSNWEYRGMGNHGDLEAISANFELEILDQLLVELVGQLARHP
ncbi:hypothetical protein F2P56_010949 [Juglans regia]|uniref:DUF3741 domain-containing protein n=2 Tax=Juglans regia TaxID=51240 RepID=A0A834CZ81_JUGRE|nr:uncharacterized protein LOC108989857 [Juglans regia]KAF5470435.1 hypothetical protein F2P56_010949 [Juglans regia]